MHNNKKFTVTICSFEIDPFELKNEPKDKLTHSYKVIINLKDGKNYNFKGNIFFGSFSNHFIYDFKFNDYRGIVKDYSPPVSINFSKLDQLKFFMEYLKKNNIKARDDLYIDFIIDSQKKIFNESFALDFFMEIFKACYCLKEVKFLLCEFRLEKLYIPLNFNYNNYSAIINLIDKKPTIIEKYFIEENGSFNYYVKLYTIIFFL